MQTDPTVMFTRPFSGKINMDQEAQAKCSFKNIGITNLSYTVATRVQLSGPECILTQGFEVGGQVIHPMLYSGDGVKVGTVD